MELLLSGLFALGISCSNLGGGFGFSGGRVGRLGGAKDTVRSGGLGGSGRGSGSGSGSEVEFSSFNGSSGLSGA